MKAPNEHKMEMTSLENNAPILKQTIRWRLRTAKETVVAKVRGVTLVTIVGLSGLSGTSNGQLSPEWVSRVPVGTSLSAGTAGIYVDPDGVSYITGTSGSSNTDITTVSFAPDGSTRWTQTWGSPNSGADIASGITKGSNGVLYVVGSTPGPNQFRQPPCPGLRRGYRLATKQDQIQQRSWDVGVWLRDRD